jgi:hypothetical protein
VHPFVCQAQNADPPRVRFLRASLEWGVLWELSLP